MNVGAHKFAVLCLTKRYDTPESGPNKTSAPDMPTGSVLGTWTYLE